MHFYTIEKIPNFQLNDIDDALLEWKINHVLTYINMLKCENNELITFCFDISDVIYKLKIIYKIDRWVVEFNENIDNTNKTHLIMLEMIDNINLIQNIHKLPGLVLSTIELKIDETNFDDTEIDDIEIDNIDFDKTNPNIDINEIEFELV